MAWKYNKRGITISDSIKVLKPHFKRVVYFERGVIDSFSHGLVNIFVEACKLSSENESYGYHYGHMWFIQTFITVMYLIL